MAMTEQDVAKLAQISAQNSAIMLLSEYKWIQFANDLASTTKPSYATNTPYSFTLANTTGYLDAIRIFIQNLKIDNSNTTTAGSLNIHGFHQLLGSLTVSLGNKVYSLQAGAIPLIESTFSRDGKPSGYPGLTTQTYSTVLYDAPASIPASGSATYTGYINIPLALLRMVGDPDGIAPTLSNTGFTVQFVTPTNLQGSDPLQSPFGTAGTLAVDGTDNGVITVWGHMLRQNTVMDSLPLPPPVVGAGFYIQEVTAELLQGPSFYPFQGQQAEMALVKSVAVIDNPGDVSSSVGYSNPANVLAIDLMYDQATEVTKYGPVENPYFTGGPGGLSNFLVDQRERYGDLPPGVYVFDWSAGTNASYPNRYKYANLNQFSRMGLRVSLAAAPAAGASLRYYNIYLKENLYVAQG